MQTEILYTTHYNIIIHFFKKNTNNGVFFIVYNNIHDKQLLIIRNITEIRRKDFYL